MVKRFLSDIKKRFVNLMIMLRRPRYNAKVFCIGFNKTGTTTVGKSLELLGYRNTSFNKKVFREYYKKNEIDKVLRYTAKFDSTDDLPWLKVDMIPVLDKEFLSSKFIYRTRDEKSWKKSLSNWSFNLTGKYPDLEKELNSFRKHKEFVLEYFAGRSDDFIILDVKDPTGYKKLADFLGKTTSREAFPHFNETKAMRKTIRDSLMEPEDINSQG